MAAPNADSLPCSLGPARVTEVKRIAMKFALIDTPNRPFVNFEFHYRSRALLELEGLAARMFVLSRLVSRRLLTRLLQHSFHSLLFLPSPPTLALVLAFPFLLLSSNLPFPFPRLHQNAAWISSLNPRTKKTTA
jgi:hypothetical protein